VEFTAAAPKDKRLGGFAGRDISSAPEAGQAARLAEPSERLAVASYASGKTAAPGTVFANTGIKGTVHVNAPLFATPGAHIAMPGREVRLRRRSIQLLRHE